MVANVDGDSRLYDNFESLTDWAQNASRDIEVCFTSRNYQENTHANHRANLESDFQINRNLLGALHRIIAQAALENIQGSSNILIYANLVLLGYKLELMPPVLYDLCDIDFAELERLSQSLKDILILLNKVVLDNVLQGNVTEIQKSYIFKSTAFPKLLALRDHVYLQDESPLTARDLTEKAEPLQSDATSALKYLRFELEHHEEIQLLSCLSFFGSHLDRLMRTVMASIRWEASRTDRPQIHQDQTKMALEAQTFWKRVTSLYESLTASFESCKVGHNVQLCLSRLGIDKDTFDVCFSLCSETSRFAWHRGTMKFPTHSKVVGTPTQDLCRHLQDCSKRRRPVCLVFSGSSITKVTATGHISETDRQCSFINLSAVLTPPSDTTPLHFKFNRSNALRLQCLLARSLLLFHPSSWMPEALHLDNISFIIDGDDFDIKNPYIHCVLTNVIVEDAPPMLQVFDDSETAVVMVYFGLLLLQIELSRTLLFTEEEETEEYGHEIALDRYIQKYEDDLDDNFLQVLNHCLNFQVCLENSSYEKLSPELKIRLAVWQNILKPLNQALAFNFSSTAAEIMPPELSREELSQEREFIQPSTTKSEPSPILQLDDHKNDHLSDISIKMPEMDRRTSTSTTRPNDSTNTTQSAYSSHETTGLMLARESLSSATWFSQLERLTAVLEPEKVDLPANYRPIRIAVIDSGIESSHPAFRDDKYKDCIKNPQKPSSTCVDHGTDSVDLILKVFEEADLYIAKVFEGSEANDDTASYMTEAIFWAIEQQVDIISISAGFRISPAGLQFAINQATSGSKQHKSEVLIFASAGNYGATEYIAYPARYTERVFCIFSTDSSCKNSRAMNPSAKENTHNFAILGEGVVLNPWALPLSGTSVSTAIAAGLAGKLLDFVSHVDSSHAMSYHYKLHSKQGMTEVFKLMTQGHKDEGYDCMVPWRLLPYDHSQLDRTKKRQHIARTIDDALSRL